MTQSSRRILFLNQYFPPDPAPTGLLLKEIADDLIALGIECNFVSAALDYRSSKKPRNRTIRELSALWEILIGGLSAQKPSLVISGSSPPCMAFVATLIARFHGAESIHWAMDIYPELAVELGEIKPGLLLSSVKRAMQWAYRNSRCVITLDEDMAVRFDSHGISSPTIRPWLPLPHGTSSGPKSAEPALIWIYSGNLGRAHEWETVLEAQALLENRGSEIRLVFQGGGASWAPARERAKQLGLRQCEWRGYVEQEELRTSLSNALALIITQKNETKGLLWPSKLALAMDLQRPILWIGPKGAIASLLAKSASAGIFEPGDAEGVADWVEALSSESTDKICDAATHREQALASWRSLILESTRWTI